jgi:hypothetical protein
MESFSLLVGSYLDSHSASCTQFQRWGLQLGDTIFSLLAQILQTGRLSLFAEPQVELTEKTSEGKIEAGLCGDVVMSSGQLCAERATPLARAGPGPLRSVAGNNVRRAGIGPCSIMLPVIMILAA